MLVVLHLILKSNKINHVTISITDQVSFHHLSSCGFFSSFFSFSLYRLLNLTNLAYSNLDWVLYSITTVLVYSLGDIS